MLESMRKKTGYKLPPRREEDSVGEINQLPAQRQDHFPTLKEAEEELITEALRRSAGNQGPAAVLLGITRQALNQRLTRKKSDTF
jgi:DNA-binding NtrC family response regulator